MLQKYAAAVQYKTLRPKPSSLQFPPVRNEYKHVLMLNYHNTSEGMITYFTRCILVYENSMEFSKGWRKDDTKYMYAVLA